MEQLDFIRLKHYKKNNMKKIIWLWKSFWGRKYFLTPVDSKYLKKEEILISGHRIYYNKDEGVK